MREMDDSGLVESEYIKDHVHTLNGISKQRRPISSFINRFGPRGEICGGGTYLGVINM